MERSELDAGPARGGRSGELRLARFIVPTMLVLFLVSLAWLLYSQPLVGDDYDALVRLRAYPSLAQSIHYYYATWSGRVPTMVIGWFAIRHRLTYSIARAIAFGLVAMLSFAVAKGRLPRRQGSEVALLALVLLTYWFALPALRETVIWLSGSAAYLWSLLALLAFAYPYSRWLHASGQPTRSWMWRVTAVAGMFALGLVTGSIHEQVVVAVVVYLIAAALITARKQQLRDVPIQLWAGAGGLLIGIAVLFLAPGNSVRQASTPPASILEAVIQLGTYVAKSYTLWLGRVYPWVVLIAVLVLPLSWIVSRDWPTGEDRWLALTWAIAAVCTLAVFVVQPVIANLAGERTASFAAVLLTVSALALTPANEGRSVVEMLPSAIVTTAVALLLFAAITEVLGSVQVANQLNSQLAARHRLVEGAKQRGTLELVVPPLKTHALRTVFFFDITDDPSYWYNRDIATLWGVHSIRVDPTLAPSGP